MLDFLVNNWINFVIGGVLIAAAVFAVVKIVKSKHSKKGCGSDCSKCGGYSSIKKDK